MQNSEFSVLWKQYEPLIQAVIELFHPFVEAAVHDLVDGHPVQHALGCRAQLAIFGVYTRKISARAQTYSGFALLYGKVIAHLFGSKITASKLGGADQLKGTKMRASADKADSIEAG